MSEISRNEWDINISVIQQTIPLENIKNNRFCSPTGSLDLKTYDFG